MQYEDWPFHPSRLLNDQRDREKIAAELSERFLQELKDSEEAAKYLAPFSPDSRERFLKHYAFAKSRIVAYADLHMMEVEKGRRELRYREQTEDVFIAILQKKLFNAEILWRAGQLNFPGIRTTWDFHRWEKDARYCPFLDPVTEEELELMQHFLETDDCDLGDDGKALRLHWFLELFQRDEEGNYFDLPEWFEYYDTYLGTGDLLLLPDIRGEKEAHYRSLCAEESRQAAALNPPPPRPPLLPSIGCFSLEEHYEFSKVVDDEIFQQLFHNQWLEEADKAQAENEAGIFDIDSILLELESVPDPPAVRGGVSWREAIYYCWQDYLKSVIIVDLPLVWEEEKFYRETGLRSSDRMEEEPDTNAEMVAEQILHGRELAGEPRDFDY